MKNCYANGSIPELPLRKIKNQNLFKPEVLKLCGEGKKKKEDWESLVYEQIFFVEQIKNQNLFIPEFLKLSAAGRKMLRITGVRKNLKSESRFV